MAAVPRPKWREAAAYGDYLKAKQHEFWKVPMLRILSVCGHPRRFSAVGWHVAPVS